MVPIPVYEGKPLVPFNGTVSQDLSIGPAWNLDQVTLNDWGFNVVRSLSISATQYGPMLGIEANETGYFDQWKSASSSPSANVTPLGYGNYRYNKTAPAFDEIRVHVIDMFGPAGSAKTNDTADALAAKPLYPDAGNAAAPYGAAYRICDKGIHTLERHRVHPGQGPVRGGLQGIFDGRSMGAGVNGQ